MGISPIERHGRDSRPTGSRELKNASLAWMGHVGLPLGAVLNRLGVSPPLLPMVVARLPVTCGGSAPIGLRSPLLPVDRLDLGQDALECTD